MDECDGNGVLITSGSYPGDVDYESCPGCPNCQPNVIGFPSHAERMMCTCGSEWFNLAAHFQRVTSVEMWRLAGHATTVECVECGQVRTLCGLEH